MELTDFLRERLDEDEAVAREVVERAVARGVAEEAMLRESGTWVPDDIDAVCVDAGRVLADIAAKRAIVALYESSGLRIAMGQVVRLLAQPYVEHADFDERWKP